MSPTPPRWMLACYRAIIRLQPAAHRRRYGDEQLQMLAEMWALERPTSRIVTLAWSLHLLVRAIAAAAGAHGMRLRAYVRGIGTDARFTCRALARSPWYAATVIGVVAATLALATTVFAIVDGVLFRPLPYPNAERLVSVHPEFRGLPPRTFAGFTGVTFRNSAREIDLEHWRAAVPEARFTAFFTNQWTGLLGVNRTAGAARIDREFFDVTGVHPLLGEFQATDFLDAASDRPIQPIILLFDTWQDAFGGDAAVIGRTIMTDASANTGVRVVGVMPPGFSFPSAQARVDVLAPFVAPPLQGGDRARTGRGEVIARLPAELSRRSFAAQLSSGVAAAAAAFPNRGPRPQGWSEDGWRREGPYDTVEVRGLRESLQRRYGALLTATFISVASLLLIAAANVSSLMTARAWERRRELVVRRALGASTAAIGRLWLAESGVLLAIGAVIGVAGAAMLVRLVSALLPPDVVLLKTPRIDWRVGGFVLTTVALLMLAVAVAPVRRSLRRSGPGDEWATDRTRSWPRLIVVGGQVGTALVLAVLGVFLVGSVLSVYSQGLPDHSSEIAVITGYLQGAGASRFSEPNARRTRLDRIRDQLRQMPGVAGATFVEGELLEGPAISPGFRQPPGVPYLPAVVWGVGEGFYQTVSLAVLQGRLPTNEELRTGAPLLVVSERLARGYWPEGQAVGQTLTQNRTQQPYTVIGVVRDVRWTSWDREIALIYVPYTGIAVGASLNFLVRTRGTVAPRLDEALDAVHAADSAVSVERAMPMDALFRDSILLRRFQAWLFGSFAVAGLAVVGAGMLGLLAMSVARRTREIGIRCALGATPAVVTRQLMREHLATVLAGLVVGALISAWAVGFVRAYLYAITPTDPRAWAAAIALVCLTSGVAALLPAIRASRVDPVKALRAE